MKTYTSTVIISMIFNINVCFSKYGNAQDTIEIPCSNTGECHDLGFEDFICRANKCIYKTVIHPAKLGIPVSKLGLPCENSKDCMVADSYCKEKKCACTANYVESEDERTCLNSSFEIGKRCREHAQCFSLNARCINQTCQCAADMHLDKGFSNCFKSVGLGLFCTRDEECLTDFSSCVSNKCTCDKSYIKSETSSKCLSEANDVLSTCSEDVQCKSTLGFGSVCSRGFCMCKDVYHYKKSTGKCVRGVFLGKICAEHSDCHQPGAEESHLECILGECECKPNYVETDGFCINSSTSIDIPDLRYFVLIYMLFYLIV